MFRSMEVLTGEYVVVCKWFVKDLRDGSGLPSERQQKPSRSGIPTGVQQHVGVQRMLVQTVRTIQAEPPGRFRSREVLINLLIITNLD